MKRLLAYLFIVLGLGIFFNPNSWASKEEMNYCIPLNKKRSSYTAIGIPCSPGYTSHKQKKIEIVDR